MEEKRIVLVIVNAHHLLPKRKCRCRDNGDNLWGKDREDGGIGIATYIEDLSGFYIM